MAAVLGIIALLLSVCGTGLGCNSDWTPFQGSCYMASQNMLKHEDAIRFCELAGGSLALGNGLEYIKFFNKLKNFNGKEEYWLQRGSRSGTSTTTGLESETGNTTTTTTTENPHYCPYVKILDVPLEFCTVEKYFICEMKERTLNCPTGFDSFESNCLKAVQQKADYNNAVKNCALQQGQLAILDPEEKELDAKKLVIGKNQTFVVAAKRNESGIFWANGIRFDLIVKENFDEQANGNCVGLLSNPEEPLLFSWTYVECNEKYSYMCEAQPVVTTTTEKPTTKAPPPPPLVCPHGQNWKAHNVSGYCFWETTYETDTMNWYQAREFCMQYGGDLASYSSQTEENVGLAGARGHYKGLWIGMKRDENDNTLYWADGTNITFLNWDVGQPDNDSPTKFCVTHSGKLNAGWELDYCGVRRWFICKAPMVRNQIIPNMPDKKVKCEPIGVSTYRNMWYRYEDHCYLVHEINRYTWDTARTFCQDNDGLLASVHSFEETNFILTLTTKSPDSDFWIGLSAHGLDSSFTWSDNTSLDFIYWQETHDATPEDLNSCVTFNKRDGSWTVNHCNRLLSVICKRGLNGPGDVVTTEPPVIMPGKCQNGWYNYGNNCYKSFGTQWSQRVTWSSAMTACKEMGASLVSIHSEKEQDLLTDVVLEATTDLWIGLQSKESGALFYWSDNTRMDYTNWGMSEPHFSNEFESFMPERPTDSCVIMEYNQLTMGKWDDVSCSLKKGYVCQKDKDPNLKEYQDPFMCTNISGWYKLGSSCYGIFENQNLNWLEAQRECSKFGADLITYKNMAVPIFLRKKINQKQSYFWIGVREKMDSKYETVTGAALFYTNWRGGQPRAASSVLDNCVATFADGSWAVKSCREKLPFICRLNQDIEEEPEIDPISQTCGHGEWYDFGGVNCYLFMVTLRKSWGDAMHYCFKHGGYLASIHSAEDIEHIMKQVRVLTVTPRSIHIGLGKKFDGSYSWVDGSALDYTAWDEEQPSMEFHCTSMSMVEGKWNTVDCDDAIRGFVCSSPKRKPLVEALATNSSLQQDIISHKLSVGGIFGVVICVLVILAVIGLVIYYLRPTKQLQPKLLDPEPL